MTSQAMLTRHDASLERFDRPTAAGPPAPRVEYAWDGTGMMQLQLWKRRRS